MTAKDLTDKQDAARPIKSRLISWGMTMVYIMVAIAIVAMVRTFVVQTFVIPSGSMENTLVKNDRVAVSMYDTSNINRGDIVVFTDPDNWLNVTEPTGLQGLFQNTLETLRILPKDSGHHIIKRVIGMPGDHIVADGEGSLSVNGVKIDEPYLKPGRSQSDVAFDVVVPAGHVWVMGDNRANSADSRFYRGDANDGFVPLKNVVGVAKAVVWPVGNWAGLSEGQEAFAGVPEAGNSDSNQAGEDAGKPGSDVNSGT